MSVDECIAAYTTLSQTLFRPYHRGALARIMLDPTMDMHKRSNDLENGIRDLIVSRGLSSDTKFLEGGRVRCKVLVRDHSF